MKPEKAVLDYIYTNKRIKILVEVIAAVKHMDRAAVPDRINLATLLLESGTAKNC